MRLPSAGVGWYSRGVSVVLNGAFLGVIRQGFSRLPKTSVLTRFSDIP